MLYISAVVVLRRGHAEMKHYIEREKLIENINASRAFTDLGIDGSFLRARALELIDSLPVANVREVKHGTWEDSVFAPGVLC